MEESIFKSIKALLGPDADYDVFDQDILIFINSALATLTQIGIGPDSGFRVVDESATWDDLFESFTDIDSVKQYIFMKVKMGFDPPSNSFVMSAYQDACKELEWRLNVAVDPKKYS